MRRTTMFVSALLVSGLVSGLVVGTPAAAEAAPTRSIQPIPGAASAARPVAPRAGAAVVIGQTSSVGLGSCPGAPYAVAVSVSGGGASYTVPSAGVLTSWSTTGAGAAGNARPLLFVDGIASHKTLVAKGDFQPVPNDVLLRTFPVRIPVQSGQQLGLGTSVTGMACAIFASVAGDVIARGGFNADASTDFTFITQATIRPNISAVLEPDVDGDLYGDITQDLCPQSATTQAACPAPDTTVTKKPKKKSSKRKAKIVFSSTVAGSTFTCAVDKKAAKPCTSPFKKKYKYGKHKVVITATSPAGIVDPTPVTVKFKIKKPGR